MNTSSNVQDDAQLIAKVSRTAYTRLSDPRLLIYANNVIALMEGNEVYAAFTDSVADLSRARDAYSTSLSAVSTGGSKNMITLKKEDRGAVIDSLDVFEMPLNAAAKGMPSFITGAGFTCWRQGKSSELTKPSQPYNISIKADPDTSGVAIVSCRCPANEGITSVVPSLRINGEGEFVFKKTIARKGGKIEGLPSGQPLEIKLSSVGRRGMQSDPTIAVSLMVV